MNDAGSGIIDIVSRPGQTKQSEHLPPAVKVMTAVSLLSIYRSRVRSACWTTDRDANQIGAICQNFAAIPGAFAIYHHHAQQAHDRDGGCASTA